MQGRHELREALTKKLKKENKIDVSPDEIVITCGSKEALLLSMLTVIDKGQNVIIPDPGYVAYRPIVQLIDGIPKHLHLREEDGFAIHPEQLKKTD